MADAIDELKARVRASDPRAMATWGRMLVTGDGVAFTVQGLNEGILCLRDADHKGDAEAPAVLASMAAFGRLEPRNFGRALQLLETSAQRGWAPAQQQLRLLGRAESNDWPALRRAAAAGDLRKPPPSRVLSERPRLRVFENFATPAECDWIISRVTGHLERAKVYLETKEQGAADIRTNTETYVTPKFQDVVSAVVLQRVAAAVGTDLALSEFATVLHYEPGEVFGPHADFFDPNTPSQREEISLRGQRIATHLVYLNDDYDGGETHFIDADIRYKGRKGDALLFINVDENGAPDRTTMHQGLPPTRGEKWVLSQWVREQPLNSYLTPGGENVRLPPTWLQDVWV